MIIWKYYMQVAFIDDQIKYDGTQLSSHFAYRQLGLLGDSCVAFVGPCDVALSEMVDLEDVRAEAPIYSPSMLHFILENFLIDLRGAVLLQRLLVSEIQEELRQSGVQGVERRGDDLFFGEKKLSVSIATVSPISALIHIGLNITTKGTPVPTVGLAEWRIDPLEFGKRCLKKFQEESLQMERAAFKVRSVR